MKIARQKGWTRCLVETDEVDARTIQKLIEVPGVVADIGPRGVVVSVPDTALMLRPVRDFVARGGMRGEISEIDKTQSFQTWTPKRPLFPHQNQALFHMLIAQKQHGGVILADEMGLAKTSTAIVAAQSYAQLAQKKWKLVIGLKYLRDTWRNELVATGAIAHPDDLVVFAGIDSGMRNIPPNAEWFFIHYDIIHHWRGWLYQAPFGVVIADEAHLARNPKSLRGKALDALGPIPFRIVLTGTPLVNRPAEMWKLLTFATGARSWGSHFDFRLAYCGAYHDGHGYHDGEPTNVEELTQRLLDCYLRRTFDDAHVKLPPFTRRACVVDMPDRAAYDEAARELSTSALMQLLIHGGAGQDTLGTLGKLRSLTARAKIGATVEQVISFLDQEEPVVVFTHERATARAIVAKLAHKGYDAFDVTGEDTAEDRGTKVRAFQSAVSPVALVATIDSLGVGVTLHRARVVVIHDLPWTFAALVQGEKRIHRIGQTRPCTSIWMLAEKSVDTLVGRVLLEKAKHLSTVLGDDEAVLAADEVELAKIVGVDDDTFKRHLDAWVSEVA